MGFAYLFHFFLYNNDNNTLGRFLPHIRPADCEKYAKLNL